MKFQLSRLLCLSSCCIHQTKTKPPPTLQKHPFPFKLWLLVCMLHFSPIFSRFFTGLVYLLTYYCYYYDYAISIPIYILLASQFTPEKKLRTSLFAKNQLELKEPKDFQFKINSIKSIFIWFFLLIFANSTFKHVALFVRLNCCSCAINCSRF